MSFAMSICSHVTGMPAMGLHMDLLASWQH
jgi:hypothetical protein